MHARFPLEIAVGDFIAVVAELALPLFREIDFVGHEVPIPESDVGALECEFQAALCFAQGFLGTLSISDVFADGEQQRRLSVAIEKRHLPRMHDNRVAAAGTAGLFRNVDENAFPHYLLINGLIVVGLLDRPVVVTVASDHFLPLESKNRFGRLVPQPHSKTVLWILHEHSQRNVLDDVLQ